MAKFCGNCGNPMNDNAKFCKRCGAVQGLQNSVMKDISSMPGEFDAGIFGDTVSDMVNSAGQGAAQARNIAAVAKNKSFRTMPAFISAIVLAVIWIIQLVWMKNGTDNILVKLTEWITFARGGVDRSFFGTIGGLIGKGTVASALAGIVGGGIGATAAGFKRSFNGSNFSKGTTGYALTGIGLSFILYQIFTGNGSFSGIMSAVAGMLVSARAIEGGSGILYGFARSVTSRKQGNVKQVRNEALMAFLGGITVGFAFAVPVSIIPLDYTHLFLGLIIIIVGLILTVSNKNALIAGILLISFIPFGINTVYAKPKDFTIRSETTDLLEHVNYSSLNLSGMHISHDEMIKNALKSAGDINVKWDGSSYHMTIPAIRFEIDEEGVGANKYPLKVSVETDDILLSAPELSMQKGSMYYNGSQEETYGVCFTLDAPAEYRQHYDTFKRDKNHKSTPIPVTYDVTGEFKEIELYLSIMDETDNSSDKACIMLNGKAGLFTTYDTGSGSSSSEPTFSILEPFPMLAFDVDRGLAVQEIISEADIDPGEQDFDMDEKIVEGDTEEEEKKKDKEEKKEEEREEKKEEKQERQEKKTEEPAGSAPVTIDDPDDQNNNDGISGGVVALLGAGGILAGALGAVAAGSSAGEKKGQNNDPAQNKGTGSKYKMKVYKDFGNTVSRGEQKYVYARIVEIDQRTGQEIPRPDMTANISIFCTDGSFNVSMQDELAGNHKGAAVSVTDGFGGSEGFISFSYRGVGGTFINHMKFKVNEPRIIFYQENLALPAGYDKHEPLQFTIEGFDLNKVKVTVDTSLGSSYAAELVPSENAPGTYFAMITDIDKSVQEAGSVAESTLFVTAQDENVTVSENFKLLRVNEGLNIALPALNCYRVVKESAAGKTVENLTKDDLVPATTTAQVILVLYNEEEHTIDQMPVVPEFKLEPVENDTVIKQRIDELGIEAKLTKVEPGYAEMTFFCTKAYLEPPCRFRVNLKASCSFEGKIYTCEKEVLMRSQPIRSFQSNAAESAGAADDKETARRLNYMLGIIARNNWEDELPGEVIIARLLLDNYEWCYGYDALLTYQVLDNFYRFLAEQNRKYLIEQAEALREADPGKDDFYHELEYRTRFLDSWGGIALRIGLAIGTGGWSEAAFITMDVNRAVVKYNDSTPKEMRTTWGQVKAGAVPVAVWLAFAGAGKAAGKVIPKVGAWTSKQIAGSKLMPQSVRNVAEKVGKYFAETAENVKNCDPRKVAERAANAEKSMNAAAAQGEAEANVLLKGMSNDLTSIERLMEAAQKAGNKEGEALLKELKLAVDTYRLSGSSEMAEKTLKDNIVKLCQNKFAIEQLIRENPGQADVYRRLITNYRNTLLYEPIKNDSRIYIAEMLKCDPNRIKIKSVSGNTAKALKEGKAFGHDLDVTYVYENMKGELVELPQAIAEEALYKTSCRHAGIEFKSMAEARRAAEKLQIHACQASDAERLPEVQKLLDSALRTEALEKESVGGFVNAETYKSVTPYRTGMEQIRTACPDAGTAERLLKQLNDFQAGRGTLSTEARTVIEGVGNVKEGFRSFSKGCNILKNKAIGADTVGGRSVLTEGLHTVDGIAKEIASGNVSVAKGNKLINSMGGFESNANACFNQMQGVNGVLINGASPAGGLNAAAYGAAGNAVYAQ